MSDCKFSTLDGTSAQPLLSVPLTPQHTQLREHHGREVRVKRLEDGGAVKCLSSGRDVAAALLRRLHYLWPSAQNQAGQCEYV